MKILKTTELTDWISYIIIILISCSLLFSTISSPSIFNETNSLSKVLKFFGYK